MKVLVVYDSVSPMKLTEKVGEVIREVLQNKGIQADSFHINDVDATVVKNYDCLVAGCPTMYFRATRGINKFLSNLPRREFSDKLGAAFDTQIQGRFTGNAAKGIEKKLKNLKFKIIAPSLNAYVEGKMNQMNLKEGELEKTKAWAQTLADTLSK